MALDEQRQFLVVLDRDAAGPIYLGRLDGPLQGVRMIENATRYTEHGARTVAGCYRRAVAIERKHMPTAEGPL